MRSTLRLLHRTSGRFSRQHTFQRAFASASSVESKAYDGLVKVAGLGGLGVLGWVINNQFVSWPEDNHAVVETAAAHKARSVASPSVSVPAQPYNYQTSMYGPNTVVLNSAAITRLFTVIRDKNCSPKEYVVHSDRLMTILAEEGLAHLPNTKTVEIETHCGTYHNGIVPPPTDKLCAVSIVRSGDILLEAVRTLATGIAVGKILLQRDEEDAEKKPKLYYSKLPKDIVKKEAVMLVDPMLATGGSALKAIEILRDAGVEESKIVFLNLVACPEGINAIHKTYPTVTIVTCAVDEGLNDDKFIVPGLGDFGDRYYSTEECI